MKTIVPRAVGWAQIRLFADIKEHNVQGLSQLLEYNVDLEFEHDVFSLPLHFAIKEKKSDMVLQLLDRGADPNAIARGTRALHIAAELHDEESLKLLLDHGANVNLADSQGETAIFAAVRSGDVPIAKELLAAGANLGHLNEEEKSVLAVATECNQPAIARLLLEGGSDVNGPCSDAYDKATDLERGEVQRHLVFHGGRSKVRAGAGRSKIRATLGDRLERVAELEQIARGFEDGVCFICGETNGLLELRPCKHRVVCANCVNEIGQETQVCPHCGLSYLAAV